MPVYLILKLLSFLLSVFVCMYYFFEYVYVSVKYLCLLLMGMSSKSNTTFTNILKCLWGK